MISRSLSELSHLVSTPRLASTSSSRLTSSMRATLRSVVRPRLSSEAHSSATPAFFEVLTSMLPDQLRGAGDPQVGRAGAEGDDLGVQCGADPLDHLQGEVLMTLLDPVDRALGGAQEVRQLLLGEPPMLAGVADDVADASLVSLAHARPRYLRYEI